MPLNCPWNSLLPESPAGRLFVKMTYMYWKDNQAVLFKNKMKILNRSINSAIIANPMLQVYLGVMFLANALSI
jgi:hypothetical protein